MRWIKRVLLALAALVVVLAAIVYGGSEWMIHRSHAVPMAQLAIPHDSASIAEGGRLAKIAACRDCHGRNGEGKVLFQDPMLGRIAPPALARVAATMSDAELVRAIRQGVHKDGSTLFIMPTRALGHLADADVARIVAWVRTLKPGPQDSSATTGFGPIGRALILAGKLPASATAETVSVATRPVDSGAYFVQATCLGCHKLHAAGTMEDGTTKVPALASMAASYDDAAFQRLLHTGVGLSKRDLGLMSMVSREAFSALSDAEVAQIHAFLKGEAAK